MTIITIAQDSRKGDSWALTSDESIPHTRLIISQASKASGKFRNLTSVQVQ